MPSLKSLFGASPAPLPIVVTARLNAKVQPVDRHEMFEDPLDATLRAEGLGEVTGGGTQLADEPYGIAFCDLEIGLHALTDDAVERVIARLEEIGAPKGSTLRFDDDERAPISFGAAEGLALALNGTDLPAEVYAGSDVNELIETLNTALGRAGKMKGYWEGSRETMLYFYGPDYPAMEAVIRPITDARPDTQLSRIERIA